MNIAIIGLGLIGGSLAKSFLSFTDNKIFGYDKNKDVIKSAIDGGFISEKFSNDKFNEIDVIYLCMYPMDNLNFIRENLNLINEKTIITDVSGIKKFICSEMKKLLSGKNIKFIGSHPMAGKEVNGFENSDNTLFKGASYIIVADEKKDKAVIDILSGLALSIGFSSITVTDPDTHDKMIAYTSQLPHVLACSYVLCEECLNHKGFSAGSYKDVSRVAKINEVMWTELFIENKSALVSEINSLIDNMEKLKSAIENENSEELKLLLKKSRLIKETVDKDEEITSKS